MQENTVKDQARKLLERLPENVSWDDVMYEIYVRQAIEAGLKDSDEGHTIPVQEVRTKFGLPR